ncbi:hypothetical protein NDU88_004847 [Pleurodeles waltl]|uniref:Reverse transcriptase domain-containing protein n=1 Tax=Pleurodeles waltl TaxID=8319 RepID=A0AAV7SJZ7_PLEWA|nr:hypothetical protein NDU88_004847 [Pleurodeles waltl]
MIALLYKHKGERCDLKKWRPISLLNVDYKILAKTMVNRLKGAMGEIVHPDQTCGLPGRRVADSLALIRDTIQYITDRNICAELLAEYIRKNPNIRGIPTPGDAKKEVKCMLYMDDVTLFCTDGKSVQSLLEAWKDFGKASGAKINMNKSQAKVFGRWDYNLLPLLLGTTFPSSLGATLGHVTLADAALPAPDRTVNPARASGGERARLAPGIP